VLVILTLVAYLVVTSSGFISASFFPALAPQFHADVTVTDISVHPFSKITVRGLKVQAKGQEPVIHRARRSAPATGLWSILPRQPASPEIALVVTGRST